ncbi:MAG: hydrolase 1, exosortase A system-associated [Rubrivivax sp.]|nr:hydrolase 1, exosortase A system-associated [Rubrivivax sp.]
MTVTERVLCFECQGESLVGILTAPQAARDTAVIVVVGGPQYRAGSHRQFTLLARRLAAEGWPVLRFDYRGMGDSGGGARDFERVDDDIEAAIGACMAALPGLRQVVLWGLCDGASAALLHVGARPQARVAGLCLLNPWLRSEASLARTHVKHYYLDRLRQPDFWRKLLSGGIALKAWRELTQNLSRMRAEQSAPAAPSAAGDFRGAMAKAWTMYPGAILLALSGDDYTAREFADVAASSAAWRAALQRPGLTRIELPGADHTLSQSTHRLTLEADVLRWLQQRFAPAAQAASPAPEQRP